MSKPVQTSSVFIVKHVPTIYQGTQFFSVITGKVTVPMYPVHGIFGAAGYLKGNIRYGPGFKRKPCFFYLDEMNND